VWSTQSKKNLDGTFYRYNISVYHPDTGAIETYEVTDPYSLSLGANSEYSQVVDLDRTDLKPSDWGQGDYVVDQPEEIVIYESHIRDLTLSDTSGTAELNGKYGAFAEMDRASMQHIQALQKAGLTHMHLMPSFDIATTIEFDDQQANIDDPVSRLCELSATFVESEYASLCSSDQSIRQALASFPKDSEKQQDFMSYVRPLDNFNWGYDPYHYTVPEGSYATDADGEARILEYRNMVQNLHNMNLNVVMDVVYNHTNESGLATKSVLDKIVPGYYHRLNVDSGAVENSTCCKNTATEHSMMEKLMIDSLVVWARDYHIDAFRFDLMGHHMKVNVEKALAAVQAVRPHVYFYGEGWNFGEVANGARGENAIQWTMAGTGVGTFSDRLRDAVRGGGPFDEKEFLRINQGFGNGLYYLPNEKRTDAAHDKDDLMHKTDQIRVGLAGNLRDFLLVNKDGFPAYGQDIDYNGQPAGYTLDPQENITYVSKHDNQTLWDNNQYRIAEYVTTDERVRMQNLGLATNMMAQGIPFFHMGSDIIRSKSMERDSYDSGDWFNAVDFSLEDSTWARGLPREDKDGNNWFLVKQAFANEETYTDKDDRAFASDVFKEFLTIRKNNSLFHLPTSLAVQQRVDFHNTGADQIPGVIVMSINDGKGLIDRDENVDAIVVVINASDVTQGVAVAQAEGFELHPIQQASVDGLVQRASFSDGEFRVPGLSVAVFVLPQAGEQGIGLPVTKKDLSQMPPLGKNVIHLMGTVTRWDDLSDDTAFKFEGNGVYAIELPLEKGFYKVKTGNNADLEYGKLGAFLKVDSEVALASPGGVMNLQLSETGTYRFELNLNDMDSPELTIKKQ
jgi:pullulanase-type alpha-1,6-glucosidase